MNKVETLAKTSNEQQMLRVVKQLGVSSDVLKQEMTSNISTTASCIWLMPCQGIQLRFQDLVSDSGLLWPTIIEERSIKAARFGRRHLEKTIKNSGSTK
jgi:hypothetical protein